MQVVAALAIEERIKRLENKVALLASVTDCDKHPFICACLDADMDTEQVDKILALITKVVNSIGAANSISYSQFEEEIKVIVPSKANDSQFVKKIIKTLNKENKFILGTEKFRAEGITI